MSRLWPSGVGLAVTTGEDGIPQRLTWQGQAHEVAAVTRRWRVNVDWWRARIWRDYFKLTTRSGLLLVVYHDLQDDGWYLQRLYD